MNRNQRRSHLTSRSLYSHYWIMTLPVRKSTQKLKERKACAKPAHLSHIVKRYRHLCFSKEFKAD